MGKKKSPECLYNEVLKRSGFNLCVVEDKWGTLSLKNLDVNIFQVKASIVFLSGKVEDIDGLIAQANQDHWKVMNIAQVKSDRT